MNSRYRDRKYSYLENKILPYVFPNFLSKSTLFPLRAVLAWDSFAHQGSLGNAHIDFLVLRTGLGGCCWHLLGRSQGCCQPCYHARTVPCEENNAPLNVNRSEVKDPWSKGGAYGCHIHIHPLGQD